MKYVHFALIHAAIKNSQTENQKYIYECTCNAIQNGANFIVHTELALSGYCFGSREEALACACTATENTITQYAELSKKHQVFIGIGFLEKCSDTALLYNSYVIFNPKGEIVCHYRKIQAEMLWATSGNPWQNVIFETPWGIMGVIICADSYQGLMCRKAVLQGAKLLIIPANWPKAVLDPSIIWQARSIENGVYVLACNRSGKEKKIDFTRSQSCVFNPQGKKILQEFSGKGSIFSVSIPLDKSGMLSNTDRKFRLSSRATNLYYPITLARTYFDELTSFLGVPSAIANAEVITISSNYDKAICLDNNHKIQIVLYPQDYKHRPERPLTEGEIAALDDKTIKIGLPQGKEKIYSLARDKIECFPIGPFMVCPATLEEAMHPEFAYAAAKSGADILIIFSRIISKEELIVLQARTAEQVSIALAGQTSAIFLPSRGHCTWEQYVSKNTFCSKIMDEDFFKRRKRFQDKIAFEYFWQNWK